MEVNRNAPMGATDGVMPVADFSAVDEYKAKGNVPVDVVFMLRDREKEVHGHFLEHPSPEAMARLDQWQDEETDPSVNWLNEYYICMLEDVRGVEVLGDVTAGTHAALSRPAAFMLGLIYDIDDDRKKKNTRDGGWGLSDVSFLAFTVGWRRGEFAAGIESKLPHNIGLSLFNEGRLKGGPAFVLAEAIGGARTDAAIKVIHAIGLDVDSGAELEFVKEKLLELGWLAYIYTSYSHGKSELVLKHDEVMRKLRLDESPTLTQIQTYLREHHKDRYDEDFIQSVEVVEARKQTKDGLRIVLRTAKLDKFRVILPLAEPVELLKLGTTVSQWKEAWADAVRGVAVNHLGISFDESSCDVNRAFFLPQKHPNAPDPRFTLILGEPLSFESIKPQGKGGTDPFVVVGSKSPHQHRPAAVATDGTDAGALYDSFGQRWLMGDICEAAGLETSAPGSNSGGKVHVRCAFADGHTDPSDDRATFVMNADDSDTGFAICSCSHTSCKTANQGRPRHLVEHLVEWINAGLLDPELLEDPAYMIPFGDGQEEAKFFRLTPEETKGEAEARAFLREHLDTVDGVTRLSHGAPDACATMLEGMGLDANTARARAAEAVEDVQRQIADRVADRQHDPVAAARREARGDASVPHVLDDLYDAALVKADGFMVTPEEAPKVYRSYGINASDDDAYKRMQLEIRDQMYRRLAERFSFIVLDGEAKLAIVQKRGEAIRLWRDTTLSKLYLNRAVSYMGADAKGKPKVEHIKPADVFMFERERPTFFDTCFEPDPSQAEAAARRGAFNLWNGFAADPRPGDWSLLRNHIKDNLCHGDMEHFNFFMTWLASLFARPGVKVPSSLAIIGEQGTGKSKVFDWIRRAIGAAALKVSAMRHLTGNFNAHLDGLILLVCEEAFWAGQKAEGGVIKDLISSTTLQIEGKFQNVVERPNYVNIVFISNNKWSVPVDGEDARRFFVLEASTAKKKVAAYFGAIDDQMERGGLEAMVHELMHWDPACIGGWNNLRYPPVTESLRQQAGMGLSGPAERLVSGLEAGVIAGRTPSGDPFYYVLDDKEPTDVARQHLVSFMNADNGRGNLSQEMRDAIATFLGEDADHGDNKTVIEYLGGWQRDTDAREERATGRERYVTVPALNDVRPTLARYGRG